MSTGKHNWLRLFNAILPPLLWAILIFILSSQPTLPSIHLSVLDFILKKSAHIFVYFTLYLLTWRALKLLQPDFPDHHPRIWLLALIFCLIYALTDEYHQSLVIYRTATLQDIGYDMLGVLLAFLWRYRYI